MQHRQRTPCHRRERVCAAERLIQSYLSLLVSQTPPLCSDASPPQPLGDAVVIPMKTALLLLLLLLLLKEVGNARLGESD